jgi:hypothetical protein
MYKYEYEYKLKEELLIVKYKTKLLQSIQGIYTLFMFIIKQ